MESIRSIEHERELVKYKTSPMGTYKEQDFTHLMLVDLNSGKQTTLDKTPKNKNDLPTEIKMQTSQRVTTILSN